MTAGRGKTRTGAPPAVARPRAARWCLHGPGRARRRDERRARRPSILPRNRPWRENDERKAVVPLRPAMGSGAVPGAARDAVRGICGHVHAGGRGGCGRKRSSSVSASPWQPAPARRHAKGKLRPRRKSENVAARAHGVVIRCVPPRSLPVEGCLGSNDGAKTPMAAVEADAHFYVRALNREI